MQFEWDENKRDANIQKHGFDFVDSREFFENNPLIFCDTRKNYGEKRYVAMGLLQHRLMIGVFTMRKSVIRMISMRKANDRERKYYEKIKNKLGKN
jgi:uncharacterized protein